jgi:hypothetical protein
VLKNTFKFLLFKFCLIFNLDFLFKIYNLFLLKSNVYRLSKKFKCQINFVIQGEGGVTIECNQLDPSKYFSIDKTSHIKSNTYIECSGKVIIKKYFHTGRNLTILTSNHDYRSNEFIPYGYDDIKKPVIIEDFVWCGSNVTILPGVHVGEGVVIAACSVVTKNIPDYAIVAGNPAKILKFRDIEVYKKLKEEKKYI